MAPNGSHNPHNKTADSCSLPINLYAARVGGMNESLTIYVQYVYIDIYCNIVHFLENHYLKMRNCLWALKK